MTDNTCIKMFKGLSAICILVFSFCNGVIEGEVCESLTAESVFAAPQYITSPGYPTDYPGNVNLCWTISTSIPNEVIKLSFKDFEVKSDMFHCEDEFKITTWTVNETNALLTSDTPENITGVTDSFCGTRQRLYFNYANDNVNGPPREYAAPSSQLKLTFTSGDENTARGFKIQFYSQLYEGPGRNCLSEDMPLKELNKTSDYPGLSLIVDMKFKCNGSIEKWELHAETPGRFYIGVWRLDQNSSTATLVGKNTIDAAEAGPLTAFISVPDQIAVEPGYFIGIHYDRGATGGIISYEEDTSLNDRKYTAYLEVYNDELGVGTVHNVLLNGTARFPALRGYLTRPDDSILERSRYRKSGLLCLSRTAYYGNGSLSYDRTLYKNSATISCWFIRLPRYIRNGTIQMTLLREKYIITNNSNPNETVAIIRIETAATGKLLKLYSVNDQSYGNRSDDFIETNETIRMLMYFNSVKEAYIEFQYRGVEHDKVKPFKFSNDLNYLGWISLALTIVGAICGGIAKKNKKGPPDTAAATPEAEQNNTDGPDGINVSTVDDSHQTSSTTDPPPSYDNATSNPIFSSKTDFSSEYWKP